MSHRTKRKRAIEVLEASDPIFTPTAISRVTRERHRDGRVRIVRRGRYMREINRADKQLERLNSGRNRHT